MLQLLVSSLPLRSELSLCTLQRRQGLTLDEALDGAAAGERPALGQCLSGCFCIRC